MSTTTVAFDGSQTPQAVGHFTYDVAQDRWTWSEALYAMHGYAPGEVPATTGVLAHHKHPDDRTRAVEVLEKVVEDGEPFSCYHRVIDTSDRVRSVLSVGHGLKDVSGQVEVVEGFFVDLTDARRDETQVEVESALARIAVHRETIDVAKGMVMLAVGCDADAAFQVLRQCSQSGNVKLHVLADQLVRAATSGALGGEQVRQSLEDVLRGATQMQAAASGT